MKKLSIILLTLLLPLLAAAGPVTEQQALLKAQQFMQGKTFTAQKSRRLAPKQDSNTAALYVFNAQEGGYAIVSGDDRTPAILGYSNSGNLLAGDLPENVQAWLDSYARTIEALGDMVAESLSAPRVQRPAAEYLIKTTWNQYGPYNLQCPEYEGYRCLTGCVPTALAQVMYYHRWPQGTTKAIPAYTTKNQNISLPELPPVTFQWDRMQLSYQTSDTGESADAVAQLMRYCGQLMETNYGPGGSSASCDVEKLAEYFGYSTHALEKTRSSYTTSDWEEMIYQELSEGRPVLYSGFSSVAGHEFICDGYDGNGYFHINWGWGGTSDGFYLLSVCNPYEKGAGGGGGLDGYTADQSAIFGLQPASNDESYVPTVYAYLERGDDVQYVRSASGRFENVTLNPWLKVAKGGGTFDLAWGIYDGNERVKVINLQNNVSLSETNKKLEQKVTLDGTLSDGTYIMYVLYKVPGTAEWRKATYTWSKLIATIEGNKLTISRTNPQQPRIVLKDISIEGVRKLNNPLTVTATVENIGFNNEHHLYAWFDDTFESEAAGYIDPGQTGDIVFHITPKKTGKVKLTISPDRERRIVMYTEEMNIEELLPQSLTAEATVNGVASNFVGIEGTTIQVHFSLRNTGANNYDDFMGVKLYKEGESSSSRFAVSEKKEMVSIPSGQTRELTFIFENLDSRATYSLSPYYFSELYYEWLDGIYIRTDLPFTGPYLRKNSKFIVKTTEGIDMSFTVTDPDEREVVTSYHCIDQSQGGTVTVPATANGYQVKGLYTNAFEDCKNLTTVHLPSSLASLSYRSFSGCSSLQHVNLPEGITNIPASAFMSCSSLTTVELPSGLLVINDYAFWRCAALQAITLPAQLTEISESAFGSDKGMNLTVTSMLAKPFPINDNVFTAETYANPLYVPKGTKSLYKQTDGWKNYTNIIETGDSPQPAAEPYAVYNNGTLTFYCDNQRSSRVGTSYGMTYELAPDWTENNSNTTRVVFDSSFATARPERTSRWFSGFYRLTSIQGIENLNTSETKDMSCMFEGCNDLETLDVSHFDTHQATTLNNMFRYCSSLMQLDLSSFDTRKSEALFRMFEGCTELNTLVLGRYFESKNIDYHTIAFIDCYNLSTVTFTGDIPASINSRFFAGVGTTDSPATLDVPAEYRDHYAAKFDGNKFFGGYFKLSGGEPDSYITFACPVAEAICLENWDTNGDGKLSKAEAEAVTSLNGKFYNSAITSFAELQYFEGLTALEDNAFTMCKQLTTLTIPKNVARIGESVFSGCSRLTKLEVDAASPYFCVDNDVLYTKDRRELIVCLLHKSGQLTVDQRCKVIADNAFYNCSQLTAIVLPDGLETIKAGVFVGCTSLATLHIPAKVTAIGMGGFTGCTLLNSITVDAANTVFSSDNGVLYNKSTSTLMAYPNGAGRKYSVVDGTRVIDPYAFCMTQIEEIELPATVILFGRNAFTYCSGLAKVTAHAEQPVAISDDVFSESTYATATLYVPNGTKTLYQQADGWKNFQYIVELGGDEPAPQPLLSVNVEYANTIDDVAYSDRLELSWQWRNISDEPFDGQVHYEPFRLENGEWVSVGWTDRDALTLDAGKYGTPFSISQPLADGQYKIEWWYSRKDTDERVVAKTTYAEVNSKSDRWAIVMKRDGMMTYCDKEDLSFANVKELKAYTAGGFNTATSEALMMRVTDAPAETGLLLVGKKGLYLVRRATSPTVYVNMLKGVLYTQQLSSSEGYYDNYYFDPYNQVFKAAVSGSTFVTSNSAYLQIPTQAAGSRQTITLKFDDTSGIGEVSCAEGELFDVYTVSGQVVRRGVTSLKGLPAGIYIAGGRKVVVR